MIRPQHASTLPQLLAMTPLCFRKNGPSAGALGTFREAIGMNDNGPVIPYLGRPVMVIPGIGKMETKRDQSSPSK